MKLGAEMPSWESEVMEHRFESSAPAKYIDGFSRGEPHRMDSDGYRRSDDVCCTDAIALKVKQEFAAKEKSKKTTQSIAKGGKKAA